MAPAGRFPSMPLPPPKLIFTFEPTTGSDLRSPSSLFDVTGEKERERERDCDDKHVTHTKWPPDVSPSFVEALGDESVFLDSDWSVVLGGAGAEPVEAATGWLAGGGGWDDVWKFG